MSDTQSSGMHPGAGHPDSGHPDSGHPAAGGPGGKDNPGVGRRGFLTGLVGAGIAAPLAAAAAAAPAQAAEPTDLPTSFPFHGEHQQGILTPIQPKSAFVAFDLTAANAGELKELLHTITDRARFLTTGGTPPVNIGMPPSDSGVLGPTVPADGLTITASLGATLFDDRYGLSSAKPARLRTMEDFPNDALDRSQCDGDLLLQICGNHDDAVVHALRDISRATRGGMQPRWRKDGFVSPPRPSGTPRNLLGFKDGTVNPTKAKGGADHLVWTEKGGDEPAWAVGGSYHVVRLIRMLVEFWDRVSITEQENMIGRRRDTGAPLTGTHEFDKPDYALDPTGDVIQMDAHIRLANPRTPTATGQQMLRRPYNYDAGIDANGNLDMGLIFACFNQDLERQFVTVQKRLVDEPLVDYISPRGGGYFFALPGVRDKQDWLGSGMFA
jgi:deferrochelatase/peroxidase EfeB